MKKILILSCLVSAMYSCTSLEQMKNINGGNKIEQPKVTVAPVAKLSQSQFYLTDSGVPYLLDMIAMDFSKNIVRKYDFNQIGNTLECYVGEKILINNIPGNRLEIVTTPKVQSYDFYLNNGTITFKSLYQGEYVADIYNGLQYLGTVKIQNKLKYKFTEADNYAIISKGYSEKNLQKVRDGISLYRISFPGGERDKELSFMLMDLGANDGNSSIIKEETKYLESVYSLNEQEQIRLLQIQDKVFGKNLVLDDYFLNYDKNNVYLNNYIVEIIRNKGIGTAKELEFLEKLYMDNKDPNLGALIGQLYLKNGNISKSTYYGNLAAGGSIGTNGILTAPSAIIPAIGTTTSGMPNNIIPQEKEIFNKDQYDKSINDGKDALDKGNYQEALVFFQKAESLSNGNDQNNLNFYIGKAEYLLGQKDLAKTNLLKITEEDSNFPEAYYYLGVIAHQEGDLSKSKEYLMKVRETAGNSTWGRKSSIYLMKL